MSQSYKQLRRGEAVKQAKLKRLRLMMLATVVIILLIAGGIALAQRSGNSGGTDLLQLDKHPMLGKSDAPVTIVEFGDFKCPICMQYARDILPKVKQDFVDTGIAKLYFINYSFIGEDSTTAAMGLESVYKMKPEAAWPYIEAVYHNQGDEQKVWATPQALTDIAKKENIGVNYDQLLADLKSNKYISEVRSDNNIASKMKLTGTPTILVNGKEIPLETVFNYDQLKAEIQKAQQQGAGK